MDKEKLVYFAAFGLMIFAITAAYIITDKPSEKPEIIQNSQIISESEVTETKIQITDAETQAFITFSDTDDASALVTDKVPAADSAPNQENKVPYTVYLNSASKKDFMQLPGIDEEQAEMIIELRDKIQYFSHPYELLYAEGMTNEKLAEIIDYLVVD